MGNKAKSPVDLVSPKPAPVSPLDEILESADMKKVENSPPRASSLTPTRTPTPKGSPVADPADENSQPAAPAPALPNKTLLPTPDVSQIVSQPPPGYELPVAPATVTAAPQIAIIPGGPIPGTLLPTTIPSYLPPTSHPQMVTMLNPQDDPLLAFTELMRKKDRRERDQRDDRHREDRYRYEFLKKFNI